MTQNSLLISRRNFQTAACASALAGAGLLAFPFNAQASGKVIDWNFDVIAIGRKVGENRVSFIPRADGQTRVETRLKVDVRLAGIKLYETKFISKEAWYNGDFYGLNSRTVEQGRIAQLLAKRQGGNLMLESAQNNRKMINLIYPNSLWNRVVLDRKILFDTRYGNTLNMTVSTEKVAKAPNTSIPATKYHINGDNNADLWYADDNQLLAAKFEFSGRSVEFIRTV